ncbi:hypothetical protein O197_32 [Edwardsiella phage eiAU-183]|uniref:Conserved phage protein n=2 Tax=Eiauvirus eiAU TaxID=1982112 RepID=E7EKT1_9CAUD|nr:hypothetical protein CH09_gp32 [Edwardsiella phage eiAU-183]YP_009613882.1 hypothetical protein FDI58_gp32 [Edwardsiella phage eiAU]ADV36436.1 conserved phage protein [Edwardsiella phage eiAU]AHG23448.1 hypothetical protein P858_32 [Edwardsiella phage eiAU]AHG23502.1 hypothetical protein O197_32 [Edwardsiella phage eiAU-183]
MATRMNAAIRDAIVANALVQAGLPEQERDLCARRADFTERTRQRALAECKTSDEALRALVKHIEELGLPKCFTNQNAYFVVYQVGYVQVNLNGLRMYLYRNGRGEAHPLYEGSMVDFDEEAFCPNSGWYPIADTTALDEFSVFQAEDKALRNRYTEIKASVKATISKFRTVEKLLEAWPEAKDLLPEKQAAATGTRLALSREDLNAMIRLPKE